jgi:hypothetical protein
VLRDRQRSAKTSIEPATTRWPNSSWSQRRLRLDI